VVTFTIGFPPSNAFPIKGITLELADGKTVTMDPNLVEQSQQYNIDLRGQPKLLQWCQQHTKQMHAPPEGPNHQQIITNGGNHTLEMVFSMLMDRGDSCLVEEYAYPVVIESIALPKGFDVYAVPIDSQGIIPEELETVLANLHAKGDAVKFPKVLYTVPTGQNPTGCTISAARKRAVYRICRIYDIIIVEDDPYFYLQYPNGTEDLPGLHNLIEKGHDSYLHLDHDGRVIRVDSFAKFLCPGMRLGWVSASPVLIDKLTMIIQMHTVGPSSFAQATLASLFEEWGDEGLDAHMKHVQGIYARKAEVLQNAAEIELQGLAEWAPSTAGMFLWMKLLGVEDAVDIWDNLLEESVVIVPGRIMHVLAQDDEFKSPYVRLSFASPSEENIKEGIARLARALKKYRDSQE
jgi:kynurenine/2-aminoadipate aminotransferase